MTTAPISARPSQSAAISAETSKSSAWTRTVALQIGDLLVHGHPDRVHIGEGGGVARFARGELRHQVGDGGGFGRDVFAALPDPLAHPGEIENLHQRSSSAMI